MNRIIFLLLLFPLIVQSQINFGTKGGTTVSFNKIDDNALPNSKSEMGFYLGAFAERDMGKFGLETDLQFLRNVSSGQVNYRLNGNTSGYPNQIDLKSTISMFNLYVYAKYNVIGPVGLKVGFFGSYITSSKYQTWLGNKDFYEIEKNLDFGASIGADFKLYGDLFAEVMYDHGFTNILSTKPFNVYDPIVESAVSNTSYKLRLLKVGLGYKF